MSKAFWGVVAAIVIIAGGIIWATSGNNSNSGSGSSTQPTNHVEGTGETGVKLVEYGDYECPYCSEYYAVVKQVEQKFNNQIYFQFRNLPLTQIHPNAMSSARAAEAAGLQNKFWQMHDLLYQNQDPSGQTGWVASSDALDQYFVGYAQQLGLNVTQFKNDYKSNKVNDLIQADIAAFGKTGAPEATPTFFLDGKQVNLADVVDSKNLPNVDKFSQVIQKEIDAKAKTSSTSKN